MDSERVRSNRISYYGGLWLKSIAMSWKGRMSYRAAFLFRTLSIGFGYVVQFFTIWIVVNRFESIAGWTAWEVGFLYGMHLLAYSLGASFALYPASKIHSDLITGEFDTYMVRPIPPMTYFVAKNFATGYVTHIAVAVTVLAMSLAKLGLEWTVGQVALFVLMIVGSAMIMGALHILPSFISFWVPKSENVSMLLFWTSRQFIDYPLDIFSLPVRAVLIFAIPMAFVNYLPAHLFLDRSLPPSIPAFATYLSPVVGILLISVTILCSRVALRHYTSSGS